MVLFFGILQQHWRITAKRTLTIHSLHHPFFPLGSSPHPHPWWLSAGLIILLWQAFYRLLLVAALIAASNATLDDEIIPEDNQFVSVDNSAGDQTTAGDHPTAGGQTAQEMEGIEAETDSS